MSIEPAAQAHWNPDGSAMYFWSVDNKQLSTALTIGPEGDNGRPNLIGVWCSGRNVFTNWYP